jgi:hypothetical protein
VPAAPSEGRSPKKDARWPFVMLYLLMWAGMIMTTLNRDPIKFEFSFGIIFGLLAIACIIAYLAHGRIRGRSPFTFDLRPTIVGNLALHVFILTGIMFIGYIFFGSVVQIMILKFSAPIFGCIPNITSWTSWMTSLSLTGFTSLVLVWYAISFGKAYYLRLRGS